MTLTELRAAVYEITNRPDLVAKTFLAIQAATLKAHATDYYVRDIFESGAVFDSSSYTQQIIFKDLIPRWRAAKYFRKYSAADQSPILGRAGLFTKIDPMNALDSYGVDQDNVWYPAGDVIHLRSNTEFQHILLGCYLHPDVSADTWSTWIGEDHPFAIVYEAASIIFRQVGRAQEMRDYIAMAVDARNDVTKTNILAEGY